MRKTAKQKAGERGHQGWLDLGLSSSEENLESARSWVRVQHVSVWTTCSRRHGCVFACARSLSSPPTHKLAHTHIYNMHVRRNTRFALHVGSNIYKSRKVFDWKLSWWCWDSLSCWDLFDWKVIKIFLSFSLFSQENDHFHTLQGIDYCWICVGSERNADWKCREKKRLSSPRIRKINK